MAEDQRVVDAHGRIKELEERIARLDRRVRILERALEAAAPMKIGDCVTPAIGGE